ncbi:hypothetical protein GCM10010954_13690 [Halobacillus andaensis]|uniref:Uncharacterized protein n=1 Tax=Halobacillus andaensis TaxID=1176239 RepID=A0A917B298_HALAA|nr:hypothetical protein [Halobacillus andaensis]MBP2004170.1 hypothetical protein [Halobacillus andaensis]GGF16353.1 hypothetical protein GCM10010954_13690 [Halobacillus andaensis]
MDAIKISHYKNEFLTFYEQASNLNADPEERFYIWKQHYGFNPFRKEEQREQLAKEMLIQAFPKYEEALCHIRDFEPDEEAIYHYVSCIREQLRTFEPMHLNVVFFIGDFDTDPFIEKEDNESYTLYFPIEKEWRPIYFVNELVKAVYLNQSKIHPSQLVNIAFVIFLEGLALHTANLVAASDTSRTSLYPWMSKCQLEPTRIMMNIFPHLRRSDYKAIYSFTKGTGASGYQNEAGFVGWCVVEHLLRRGYTLPELLLIPEERVITLIEKSLYQVMEESKYIQSQE